MKVLCIDDTEQNIIDGLCVKYGEVYNTEGLINYKGLPSYLIEEIGYHFVSERFIPISSINEIEFVRNYNKQLI